MSRLLFLLAAFLFVCQVSLATCYTFKRGDCNNSGTVPKGDSQDLSALYTVLMGGSQANPNRDAYDVNDDGVVGSGDYSYLSSYVYSTGSAPPFPFTDANFDITDDAIDNGCDVLAGDTTDLQNHLESEGWNLTGVDGAADWLEPVVKSYLEETWMTGELMVECTSNCIKDTPGWHKSDLIEETLDLFFHFDMTAVNTKIYRGLLANYAEYNKQWKVELKWDDYSSTVVADGCVPGSGDSQEHTNVVQGANREFFILFKVGTSGPYKCVKTNAGSSSESWWGHTSGDCTPNTEHKNRSTTCESDIYDIHDPDTETITFTADDFIDQWPEGASTAQDAIVRIVGAGVQGIGMHYSNTAGEIGHQAATFYACIIEKGSFIDPVR